MSKKCTLHTVVARSTFRSQNAQNTPCSDHFWKLRCRKSARRCGAKHISKWTCTKRAMLEPLFGVEMSKKCALFWREAHVEVISWEGLHFGASDLQVCWDDFAWQVQHFVWPGITFSWHAQSFRQVESNNRKTHWYEAVVSSALNFPFLKDVSKNCWVFDVVNYEKWGSPAELFRFRRCQVQKSRKSRRIAPFLMLSSSKTEEVSQNSFVFKLAVKHKNRQTERKIDR